eukprot:TCONS_00010788-protein
MATERIFIKDLVVGPSKKAIVGLVIAKFDKRSFPDKKEYGVMKSLMNFTIRDTPEDFINVACWGSENFISNLSDSFGIGSVVQLSDFLVRTKGNTENEEKYNPSTQSAFNISVSESYTKLNAYTGEDHDHIMTLSNYPIRDYDDYYTLGDILCNGHNLNGSMVNIMACVREVGEIKEFVSKAGKNIVKRELVLFDEHCNSFPLIIWDREVASSVNQWMENPIVLFLVDVKVQFEEFRQKMTGSVTAKTIITVYPDTPQAHHLAAYAQNNGGLMMNPFEGNNDCVDDINDVYTIAEIEEKLNGNMDEMSMFSQPFSGIVYATVSHFDLDKESRNYVTIRCKLCKRRVPNETMICNNISCNNQSRDQMTSSLEFRISLSDHTMGLDNFLMVRDVAEKTLQCNVEDFMTMEDTTKTTMKWKFLFERFKVYFKAYPAGQERKKPIVNILDLGNPNDFVF